MKMLINYEEIALVWWDPCLDFQFKTPLESFAALVHLVLNLKFSILDKMKIQYH